MLLGGTIKGFVGRDRVIVLRDDGKLSMLETCDLLDEHFGHCPKKTRTLRFAVTGIAVISKPNKRNTMIQISMSLDKLLRLTLHPVDAAGRPEPLDGPATAKVVSGDVTVAVNPDGTIDIRPGKPGDSVVEIDADAQEGPEVQILTETINVTVTHPNAVSLGITTEVIDAPPVP